MTKVARQDDLNSIVRDFEKRIKALERRTTVVGTIAGGGGPPTGTAGGVLAGTYPNPSFAVDMATQAELDAAVSGLGGSYQPLDSGLTALAAFNTNGILVQTANNTFAGRTLTGTSNRLSVTNGTGVSGDPTVDIHSSYVGQTSITTLGTIGTGTWQGSDIAKTYLPDAIAYEDEANSFSDSQTIEETASIETYSTDESSIFLNANVTGDAFPWLSIYPEGLSWGDGSGPQDVDLIRDTSGSLALSTNMDMTDHKLFNLLPATEDGEAITYEQMYLVSANLVLDSSFEGINVASNWIGVDGTFTGGSTDVTARYSTKTGKLSATGTAQAYIIQANYITGIQAGTQYTVSAWARGDASTTNDWQVSVAWFDVSNGFLGATSSIGQPLSTTWQREIATADAPVGAVKAKVAVVFVTNTAGKIFYADGIQLEEGGPTGYAPKPDEILPETVGTDEISALSITSAKIAANAIVASKISAGAINAGHLSVVSQGSVILRNGLFNEANPADGTTLSNGWTTGGTNAATVQTDSIFGRTARIVNGSAANSYAYQDIPLPVGRHIVEVWAKTTSVTGGSAALNLNANTATGTFTDASFLGTTGWTRYEAVADITVEGTVRVRLELGYDANATGTVEFAQAAVIPSTSATVIAPGSVSTGHISASSITADKLAAELVLASTIRTGEIGERRVSISGEYGIQLIGDDEEVLVDLPTDDASPASFTGDLEAASLTVHDNFTLQGTNNKLDSASVLEVTAQQQPPSSPLTSTLDPEYLFFTGFGAGFIPYPEDTQYVTSGLFYDANGNNGANATFLTTVFYNSSALIYEYHATTGVLQRAITLDWIGSSYYARIMGITRRGNIIYVMVGSGIGYGSPQVTIYRLNASDLSIASYIDVTASITGTHKHKAAIGTDGTYVCIAMPAGTSGTENISIKRFSDDNTTGGAWALNDTKTLTGMQISGTSGQPYMCAVNYVSSKWWVSWQNTANIWGANCWDGTTLAHDDETGFVHYQSGLTHDGTQFWGRVAEGAWQFVEKHNSMTWTSTNTYLIHAFTWYDSSGTPKETTISPQTALNIRPDSTSTHRSYRRRRIKLSIPARPSSVPKYRIFSAFNTTTTIAAASMKLQAATTYVGSETATATYHILENSGGAVPTSSNTWTGGTSATIKSNPASWELQGSGGVILPAGTSFPSSPADGQVYVYEVQEGTRWWFQYNSGSASSYKWEFIGGPPLWDEEAGSGTRAGSAYDNLSGGNTGPDITIPLTGDYDIEIGCRYYNNNAAGSQNYMSYKIGATGASGSDAAEGDSAENSIGRVQSRPRRKTALTSTTVLLCQYKATSNTSTFSDRWIRGTPVRVSG